MQNKSIKNNDDIIEAINIILSKHRCSFSDDELVLLNESISLLEKAKANPNPQFQLQVAVKVVSTVIRIFSIINHFKDFL